MVNDSLATISKHQRQNQDSNNFKDKWEWENMWGQVRHTSTIGACSVCSPRGYASITITITYNILSFPFLTSSVPGAATICRMGVENVWTEFAVGLSSASLPAYVTKGDMSIVYQLKVESPPVFAMRHT